MSEWKLYPKDESVKPEHPITIKGAQGFETIAAPDNTILVRPKWLPYPENKPKEGEWGDYLVTFYESEPELYVNKWTGESWDTFDSAVTAFMELPEPYEQEKVHKNIEGL